MCLPYGKTLLILLLKIILALSRYLWRMPLKPISIYGHHMPNLLYISREKSESILHNYKAAALNVLFRVSAAMTNAPIVLTQDCDMFSNDPKTPLRALCYCWKRKYTITHYI
ncbi:hypothetical protein POM88_003566 [Heracleum sosnowskyi]|uniref:Uncharacterized protein n=1 Tax=Heracleum sosnowskyi TaxID=360622 RepID=A0AAD8JJV1_9APIA|nr:hypothetical protein POM88_003566 [Heracleum sosnowskyi]